MTTSSWPWPLSSQTTTTPPPPSRQSPQSNDQSGHQSAHPNTDNSDNSDNSNNSDKPLPRYSTLPDEAFSNPFYPLKKDPGKNRDERQILIDAVFSEKEEMFRLARLHRKANKVLDDAAGESCADVKWDYYSCLRSKQSFWDFITTCNDKRQRIEECVNVQKGALREFGLMRWVLDGGSDEEKRRIVRLADKEWLATCAATAAAAAAASAEAESKPQLPPDSAIPEQK